MFSPLCSRSRQLTLDSAPIHTEVFAVVINAPSASEVPILEWQRIRGFGCVYRLN